ncbi:MAG: molybdopterin molybdotransferase MoeA [Woeseia sp.]
MLTTAQASEAISESLRTFGSEDVPLADAAGRILRQSIRAERDQPPFDRVMMDGIAVDYSALSSGSRRFAIQATQAAGDPALTLDDSANCIEIMTGAVLPKRADCIIPVERISREEGVAVVEQDYQAEQGQFIHPQGSDHKEGSEVLTSGTTISPMDVAIIASCGLETLSVSRKPMINVMSTGNELIPPGRPIEDHQVRLSNGPALVAMLEEQGFDRCRHEHIADEPELLAKRLAERLGESDVLILSGGVSMGKADYVPQVLADLDVKVVFHKISQRPGLPMWFGMGPNDQAVFALPGNPVSALVCCRQYALPALFLASARRQRGAETAVLAEDVSFKPSLTCFLPVRLLGVADGRRVAQPVKTNTSGDFTSLSGTDGYVELGKDTSEFPKDTPVPLHRWSAP